MNQYIAYFDFTSTKRNGGFIGRNGQLAFQSDNYINGANGWHGRNKRIVRKVYLQSKAKL